MNPPGPDASAQEQASMARRRAAESLACGALLALLYAFDLVGDAPVLPLALTWVVFAVSLLPWVQRRLDDGPRRYRFGLSGGVVMVAGTAMLFQTGWGPLFVSAFIIHIVHDVALRGGASWRLCLAWCLGSACTGQLLVVLGVLPSQVTLGIANGAFLGGIGMMSLLARAYGTRTEQAERTFARAEREILARKLAEARFRSLVENSHDLVILSTGTGVVTWVSPSAEAMLGLSPETIMESGWLHLIHPEDAEVASDTTARLDAPGDRRVNVLRGRHGDGTWHWWEVTSTNRLDDPAVEAIVSNLRDVTESRIYQDQLAQAATRDSLTGLLNRNAFLERLESALARARRKDNPAAVLFLDLDDFKGVNDQWGHQAGDLLLQAVAARLESTVRPGDTVGRLGGDEFVVLLEDLTTGGDADIVADRIRLALRSPIVLGGHPVAPTASIGIAVTSALRAYTADELLHAADLQMYQVKQSVTRRPRRAEPIPGDIDAASIGRGLAAGEFFLEYQPVVDLRTGRSTGVEALVRWNHPQRGRLAPDSFIPEVEALGMMAALGRRVLEDGCRTVGGWADDPRLPPITLAVNASVSQLRDPSFPSVVRQVLAETGFPATQLVIEVTESLPVTPQDEALATLAVLSDLGVRIALDDFGAGYASLAQLDLVSAHIVKLDRQLIARVDESEEGFLQSLIRFLLSLGVHVVAEGIETAAQERAIAATGARYGQGYHLARPTSPALAVELLARPLGNHAVPAEPTSRVAAAALR